MKIRFGVMRRSIVSWMGAKVDIKTKDMWKL